MHFLACGEDQETFSFSLGIGKSTVSKIIAETTEAAYSSLRGVLKSTLHFLSLTRNCKRFRKHMEFSILHRGFRWEICQDSFNNFPVNPVLYVTSEMKYFPLKGTVTTQPAHIGPEDVPL